MSGDDDEGREVIDLTAIARDDQLCDALAASLAAGDLRAAEAVADPHDPVLEFLKVQPHRRATTHLVSVRHLDRTECCGRRFDDLPDDDDLTEDRDLVNCPEMR
jgi:hypothetical protein